MDEINVNNSGCFFSMWMKMNNDKIIHLWDEKYYNAWMNFLFSQVNIFMDEKNS
jgi:hypothetical protein